MSRKNPVSSAKDKEHNNAVALKEFLEKRSSPEVRPTILH